MRILAEKDDARVYNVEKGRKWKASLSDSEVPTMRGRANKTKTIDLRCPAIALMERTTESENALEIEMETDKQKTKKT